LGSAPVPPSVLKSGQFRVGFVPLIDAAPIIAAFELGYFADESLDVYLERQIGWGNVRDKLTFGHLHGSHALLGMPAASVLRWPHYPEPLVSILSLGFGGNAITLSKLLINSGVKNASGLLTWLKAAPRGGSTPLLAHPFGCSAHHYLLRDWLSRAGIDPDRDVRLCVLPPPQIVGQMGKGYLDGCCVGEPWNSVAEAKGYGKVLAVTTELVPDHPEKVFAVSRRWLTENTDTARRVVRALVRAGRFCGEEANHKQLASMLSKPAYLGTDASLILRSLRLERHVAESRPVGRGPTYRCYTINAAAMFPSASHTVWLLNEMKRWGHLPVETDVDSIAAQCVDTRAFRVAAATMNVDIPESDFPPMKLPVASPSPEGRRVQSALASA
jgi:ABC-type nitrate/sulfonate/bicarbonate transport system substrate-binding protein